MGHVTWAPAAYKDIDQIADYIAKDSPARAVGFIKRIIVQTDKLHIHPRIGRKVPELDDDTLREIIFRSYRIIYRITQNDDIRIVAVVHAARKWKAK